MLAKSGARYEASGRSAQRLKPNRLEAREPQRPVLSHPRSSRKVPRAPVLALALAKRIRIPPFQSQLCERAAAALRASQRQQVSGSRQPLLPGYFPATYSLLGRLARLLLLVVPKPDRRRTDNAHAGPSHGPGPRARQARAAPARRRCAQPAALFQAAAPRPARRDQRHHFAGRRANARRRVYGIGEIRHRRRPCRCRRGREIEAGTPAMGEAEQEAIRRIARAGLPVRGDGLVPDAARRR